MLFTARAEGTIILTLVASRQDTFGKFKQFKVQRIKEVKCIAVLTDAGFSQHEERRYQMDTVSAVQAFGTSQTLQSGRNRVRWFVFVQQSHAYLLCY